MIIQIEYIHGTGRRAGSQTPEDIICALNVGQDSITNRIVESFNKENIAELTGTYGYPELAQPVELDILKVNFAERVIAIEILNRGATLFLKSSEEIIRLHRFIGTLESELAKEQ